MFFFLMKFFKKSFRNTIRVSSSLDPDLDRNAVGPGRSVVPDLGPNCYAKTLVGENGQNCLQRLSLGKLLKSKLNYSC